MKNINIMSIKIYNSTTPSRRFRTVINKKQLWNNKSISFLTIGLKKTGGRNNSGHITVRHIGGGNKKKYRKIDFKRSLIRTSGYVIRIEYDPNRNAFIALICYKCGILSYIIACEGLKIGHQIISGLQVPNSIGNSMPLLNILIGSIIHNIELVPGNGGIFCRSAGSYALLIDKTIDNFAVIRLSSGEVRKICLYSMATIGMVSNTNYKNIVNGKAGASRWLGIRPTVRGVAMNPVDHPHGGGEGRTSGGRPSVSPWGYPTKAGFKKKINKNRFIISRRNH